MKRGCLFVFALAVVAAAAPADESVLGIASSGRVGLNDEVIDKFGRQADFDDDWFDYDDEDQDAAKDAGRWIDVAMDGDDWYTLRGDGVLFENGRKLAHAKWPGDKGHRWVSLAAGDGRVYALCEDGRLRRDGEIVARFPRDGLDFSAVLLVAGTVFALRWDGVLFMGLSETPRFDLTGPPDPLGRREGEDGDTRFVALAADPGEDYVYALRADGAVCRAGPIGADPDVEYVASVPRPSAGALRAADRCADLQFGADGTLRVLRRTGEVFRSPSFSTPESSCRPSMGTTLSWTSPRSAIGCTRCGATARSSACRTAGPLRTCPGAATNGWCSAIESRTSTTPGTRSQRPRSTR